jgi:hypothetical protein
VGAGGGKQFAVGHRTVQQANPRNVHQLRDAQELGANDVADKERPRVSIIEQIADAVAGVNTLDRRSRRRPAHYPRPDAQSYFVKVHKLAQKRLATKDTKVTKNSFFLFSSFVPFVAKLLLLQGRRF